MRRGVSGTANSREPKRPLATLSSGPRSKSVRSSILVTEVNPMARLARRASPLVAFSLLAWAVTAHAECAWVLWSKEVVSKSVSWSIEERAAGTEGECKAEGQKALVFWPRHQPVARVDDDLSVSLTSPGSTIPISIYYRCSPTPWTRAGRRESERFERLSLAPVASYQSRPARDAPHALDRRAVVADQNRVQARALALRSEIRRAGWFN